MRDVMRRRPVAHLLLRAVVACSPKLFTRFSSLRIYKTMRKEIVNQADENVVGFRKIDDIIFLDAPEVSSRQLPLLLSALASFTLFKFDTKFVHTLHLNIVSEDNSILQLGLEYALNIWLLSSADSNILENLSKKRTRQLTARQTSKQKTRRRFWCA